MLPTIWHQLSHCTLVLSPHLAHTNIHHIILSFFCSRHCATSSHPRITRWLHTSTTSWPSQQRCWASGPAIATSLCSVVVPVLQVPSLSSISVAVPPSHWLLCMVNVWYSRPSPPHCCTRCRGMRAYCLCDSGRLRASFPSEVVIAHQQAPTPIISHPSF